MSARSAPPASPLRVGVFFLVVIVSLMVAFATAALYIPACGENQNPCSRTSSPSMAVYLAWAGVAVVVVSVVLASIAPRRVWIAGVVATAAVYVGWAMAMIATIAERG